ncbi:MAG: DUF1800 domain-containing protein [Myxococcota bacterium]|nr:DUF1800 domain-containing protein [Myxococcota bacterium]
MGGELHARRLIERATFGPRPGDPEAFEEGVEAWVHRQLRHPSPRDPELQERLRRFRGLAAEDPAQLLGMEIPPRMSNEARDPAVRKELARRAREISREVVGARWVRAVHGAHGLREVMLDFWSNHFSVFAHKSLVGALLPHYQREVLEPHALGRFPELLLAVARSPAMLVYLDNWTSTAPRFRRARRRGRGGINENYARELLELHTLGVDGGYTQQDVIEVARVFTGWSLASRRDPVFRFHHFLHDDGAKRVLGERVRGHGVEEGERLLRRLACHPATARHVCRKLVARFVSDLPPPGLVERAARRFLDSEGDIREVLAAILLAPELAEPAHRKLKTPFRFAASAVRATGGETDGRPGALLAVGRLGELPFFARTPAGFPEEAEHWIDPGALLERMSFSFALARRFLPGIRPGSAFPPTWRGGGRGRDALGLALASPDFQWA